MGTVASGGATTRVGTLPMRPLTIQLGQMTAVALVGVDGGRDCMLNEICSGLSTGDTVFGASDLKLKSMVAPEKGLVSARVVACAGTRAMAVASAGGVMGAGKGATVGAIDIAGAGGGVMARSLIDAFCPADDES
jgi:hypothetical protein